MGLENNAFVTSLSFQVHPLLKVKGSIKSQYFESLSYLITHINNEVPQYHAKMVEQYKEFLLDGNTTPTPDSEKALRAIVDCRFQPWRKKYRYMLLCDAALITQAESDIQKVGSLMKERLPSRQHAMVDKVIETLQNANCTDYTAFPYIESMSKQYHANQEFLKRPEHRILVTANMSAGKSTLINALIGKQIARTSMEACTGNVCYIYNKPFEDGRIHFINEDGMELDAAAEQLTDFDWKLVPSIASYFKVPHPETTRLCIIDTPGVNSALNQEHGSIAKAALKNENYDALVYVIKGTDLGTDAELSYLRWISKNVPHEKIIFVLNRLDEFRASEDDIRESFNSVLADLTSAGFENPIVCPFSAYFAYLIQLVDSGEELSEDERDEYKYLAKKFMRDSYDLSKYYNGMTADDMRTRSGLSGLEKILYVGGKT